MPVLDEAEYVESCLVSLLSGHSSLAVTAMDGGSTDGTLEILARLKLRYRCLAVVHNPGRTQAAAMNLAARTAPSWVRILVRVDAHAVYPPSFVVRCADTLTETCATSVVVPLRSQGVTGFQKAVAAAQNSVLGSGGSPERAARRSRLVEHAHHAAFDRAFFLSVSGYDEAFTHNEDAEFDMRAVQAGGRAWLCADLPVTYFPRRSALALHRQYRNYGRGRARTLIKHRASPRPRQLAPLVISAGSIAGLALASLEPSFGLLPLSYTAACIVWSVGAALRAREPWLVMSAVALMIMHLSWALGFSAALIEEARGSAGRSGRMT